MSRGATAVRVLPLALALTAVAGVWVAGAVWSFDEQTRYAASRGFALPWLLPLVLDGLAVSLAGVAYAAALDGRAAVQARAMTALAVTASAASNGAWAWTRTGGDPGAVALAVGVPVAANLAFEVLLSELRRQVHRRRGLPVAAPVPLPRLSRVLLAPAPALREWRAHVLDITAPDQGSRRPLSEPPAVITATVRSVPAVRRQPVRSHTSRPVEASGARDLLPVAHEIATELARDGRAVTRAALTAGVRSRGLSVSNERAGHLLAQLREGTTTSATSEGDS